MLSADSVAVNRMHVYRSRPECTSRYPQKTTFFFHVTFIRNAIMAPRNVYRFVTRSFQHITGPCIANVCTLILQSLRELILREVINPLTKKQTPNLNNLPYEKAISFIGSG